MSQANKERAASLASASTNRPFQTISDKKPLFAPAGGAAIR
jgi:hypothetical protein